MENTHTQRNASYVQKLLLKVVSGNFAARWIFGPVVKVGPTQLSRGRGGFKASRTNVRIRRGPRYQARTVETPKAGQNTISHTYISGTAIGRKPAPHKPAASPPRKPARCINPFLSCLYITKPISVISLRGGRQTDVVNDNAHVRILSWNTPYTVARN